MTEEITHEDALSYDVLGEDALASEDEILGESPKKKLRVKGTLIVADEEVASVVRMYAPHKYTDYEIVEVKYWSDVADALKRYDQVDRLVIFSHGEVDAIRFFTPTSYSQKTVSQTIEYFRNEGVTLQVSKQVDLEGCKLGKEPSKLFVVNDFFGAQLVNAWTKYHALWYADIPEFASEDEAEIYLYNQSEYMLEKSISVSDVYSVSGSRDRSALLFEWFTDDPEEKLPLPPSKKGEPDSRSGQGFIPRSDAQSIGISTSGQASDFEGNEDNFRRDVLFGVTVIQ